MRVRIITVLALLAALIAVLPLNLYAAAKPTGTLPTLYINTDDGHSVKSKHEYKSGKMYIVLDGENKEYVNLYTEGWAPIEIRGRGNSTWGMEKKPYHIRLGEKTDLFGMGESRHWILLANAMDGSHLRNTLSYNLSGALGLNQIENIHVEVVFNGKYVGLYQLTESIKIAADRIDITDWERLAEKTADAIADKEGLDKAKEDELAEKLKTNLEWLTTGKYRNYVIADYIDISNYDKTGGYLIELDEYYDEVSKFTTDNDVPIMIKSPEYLETNDEMFGYIRDYIQDMEDALYSEDGYNDDGRHYSEYMDVDSFIDYWIVNQAFKSVELLFKSCYMYKDSDGGLLTFGPVWDMDWSSGNHANLWSSSATYDEWNHSESQDREYWYRAIYDDPYFIVRVQDRWNEVKGTVEEYINSMGDWQEKLSAAADANIERWGGIHGWDFNKECSTLKTWLRNRFAWMNKQLAMRDPDIMRMGIEESDSVGLSLIGSDSYVLPADTSTKVNPADVYYNGSGTITGRIKTSGGNIATADTYVNGVKTGTATIKGGSGEFIVDTEGMYTEASGRRNVVWVIARNQSGRKVGEAYLSVRISGNTMYTVSYDSGDADAVGITPRSASCATGESFTLPVGSMTNDGLTFVGWSDGSGVYSAGSSYTMGDADVKFTAIWEEVERDGIGVGGAVAIAAVCVVAVAAVSAVAVTLVRRGKKNV